MKITEHRVADAIKADYAFLTDNPQMISLLALFQERDNFEVDSATETVKPIQEDGFLQVVSQDIHEMTQLSELPVPMDLVKERLGAVKNKVLESLKGRWIKAGEGGSRPRRYSNASWISTQSKRNRSSVESDERTNRQRVDSPAKEIENGSE